VRIAYCKNISIEKSSFREGWFVTFAPNESGDIVISIYSGYFDVYDIENLDQASLPTPAQRYTIASRDPHSAALRFERLLDVYLRDIVGFDSKHQRPLKGGGAFGIVQAYVSFIEAQDRGALHAHMVLWSLQQSQVALTPQATEAQKLRLQSFVESICSINMPLELNVCPTCHTSGSLQRNADCNIDAARSRIARYEGEPPLNVCNSCQPPTTSTSGDLIRNAIDQLKSQYQQQQQQQPPPPPPPAFDMQPIVDAAVPIALPPPDDVRRQLVLSLLRQKCNMHSFAHTPQCFKTGLRNCACRYGFPLDIVRDTVLTDDMRLQLCRQLGNEYVNKSNDLVLWLLRCNNDIRCPKIQFISAFASV
jgi:hypothetical protein